MQCARNPGSLRISQMLEKIGVCISPLIVMQHDDRSKGVLTCTRR